MKRLLTLALCAATLFVGCKPKHPTPAPVIPIEQKATHMITYGDEDGLCTSTAIAPHALLTATHCNDGNKAKFIRIDQSRRKFHIKKVLTDDRDHDIYLIDGPAFTNIVPYKARSPRIGEYAYLYGDGEGQYPSRRLDGHVTEYTDPSDVDKDAGEVAFSLPVIPGDSGSAVYGADGQIIAITTYGIHESSWDELGIFHRETTQTLDFTPAFTDTQIKEASDFVPSEVPDAPPFPVRSPNRLWDFFSR